MSRVCGMTDTRKSGIALIAGSVGMLFTMAIHPVGHGPMAPEQIARLAIVSGIAHSIAMVSVLVLFLGACGLTWCVAAEDRIAFTAIVTFGFACVAISIAAAVSGFIVPAIMKHMAQDVADAAHQWQVVIYGIFQINQAFARIYSVAASLAIVLWSVSALRNGGFGRGIAIYGCVISTLIIIGVCVGHLKLDVHGMTVIALGQAIWLIVVGYQLLSQAQAVRSHE
jgi:hypothetical protein